MERESFEWSGVAERDDLFVVDINTRNSCKHCLGGFIICVAHKVCP